MGHKVGIWDGDYSVRLKSSDVPRGAFSSWGPYVKHYSILIQDAWEVVEKLDELGYSFGLEMTNNITDDGQLKDGWEVYFCDDDYSYEVWHEDEKVAICRAAILASIPAASNEAAK